jgi:hypothetical protein
MDFRRKRVIGKKGKEYREWYDETRQYRINWRSQVAGVSVPPCYYACVKTLRFDGQSYWEFAAHRRPYKTLKAAIEACEFNRKIWNAFLAIPDSPGRKLPKLNILKERARAGSGRPMQSLPVWVAKKADQRLIEMLFPPLAQKPAEDEPCNDQDDQPVACEILPLPSEEETKADRSTKSGPVSAATESASPGSKRRARGDRAPSAKETAKEPKKKRAVRTSKASRSTVAT